MSEHTFDYRELLDDLRCRPTEWLRERRADVVREQRRLDVEELALTHVLDERGQRDASLADGVSERTTREKLEMARAMESTPRIAAAAHAGDLSHEQLAQVTKIADEASDAEWAVRAPNCTPADLARIARSQHVVTTEDAAARREARDMQMWWRRNAGMLDGRFSIPDVDGALAESVFNHMTERMHPSKGEPWDTRGHRMVDAFMELCRNYADVEPTGRCKPHLLVHVPVDGNAEVNGIPIAASTLEALRADATVEAVLVDDDGIPVVHATARPALPPKITRAVRLRDGHCRWPSCTRTARLDTHHLIPKSEGGTDDISNLCAVCRAHHLRLAPQGPYRLVGNPNQPDGLRLVHRDDLVDARAGPAP